MVLVNRFCNLGRSPIVSFILVITIFRWFSNVNLESSSMMPRCFWYIDWVTFALLNTKEGWGIFFVLRLKMTSWACLVGSGLKLIFHWKVQLCIISKSLLRSFAEVWLSWITENNDVSSSTPAVTFVHVETWPLRTTCCLLSL